MARAKYLHLHIHIPLMEVSRTAGAVFTLSKQAGVVEGILGELEV